MRAAKRQKFSGPAVTIVVGASEDELRCDVAHGAHVYDSVADEGGTQDDGTEEAGTEGSVAEEVVEEESTEEGLIEETDEDQNTEKIEPEEFIVHATVLKKSSKFFEAALAKRWKEGASRIIHLPDDEPEIAQIYFDWLYSGEIISRRTAETINLDEHTAEDTRLAKSYVFGEKIQDDDFCDDVLHALVELFTTPIDDGSIYYFSEECIELLYSGTPQGSPARLFMADVIADCGSQEWMDSLRSTVLRYPDVAIDVAVSLFSKDKRTDSIRTGEVLLPPRRKWLKKTKSDAL